MRSTRLITVVDYDPSWPVQFEALRLRLAPAVGSIAAAVEHVGSTSVPGLAAKPIIDMDLVVESVADVMLAIERLKSLGYLHQGNLGIEGREAFASPSGPAAHHLYVCVQGSTALENHLTIRDYLRLHADAAAAYGALKRGLAERFATDAVKYNEGKSEFLARLLRCRPPHSMPISG
ncbi:MAG: GrpB family protein [Steroidobacteraceae bacterium]